MKLAGKSGGIGGYFSLELPSRPWRIHSEAYKFQSARAAFCALLINTRPSGVWVPKYICNSMLSPMRSLGIRPIFYDLDSCMGMGESVKPSADELVLYVNYFGVGKAQVDRVCGLIDPAQLVIDFSQSYFSDRVDCLASIYSPRKFFGVPDGGLLATDLELGEFPLDYGSVGRCSHLLKRLDSGPESGYGDFQVSERSLLDSSPKMMSALTQSLLSSIDYDQVRCRRNANFSYLHKNLWRSNMFKVDAENVDGALCYPFLSTLVGLREKLILNRVYIPTYWPEVLARVSSESIEYSMTTYCLPLPCDQRYTESDMSFISSVVAV